MANIAHIQEHERWTHSGPISASFEAGQASALEQRSRATVAAPEPLGLWGFATGTWIVGTVIAGVFPQTAATATIPVLVVFAGLAQFIAGLFAYRRANVLASTAFCCFGAFNILSGAVFAMQAAGVIPMAGNDVVIQGFVFESFAFIALALTMAAVPTNVGLVTVLGLLAVGYCLSGIPYLANSVGAGSWAIVGNIGGWFLVASAFFAYYVGAALVVNSMWGRTLLPLGGTA
ncbi:MAG: acetate uptake transporter [Pararhizobium sp.]